MNWELLTEYMDGEYAEFSTKLVNEYFTSIQNMGNTLVVTPLHEAIDSIKSFTATDLLYDRVSNTLLTGAGSFHPGLTSFLFFLHKFYEKRSSAVLAKQPRRVILDATRPDRDEPSLCYINEYGFYRSSLRSVPTIQVGSDFSLSAQEKILFKEYKLFRIDCDCNSDEIFEEILDRKKNAA
ncbi:hypothetical protein A3740_03220 [Oleiphilus sp. HI0068]|uniref:hypothetical protein n=1 Tax=Oleiphilus sp. HI0132 TaxID=1822270 RepID=UPI0007C3B1DF|nr:hypothetical protein [Oleiphilus sp. HI0132]KZY73752.1 hypothetical protein A3740_03220 [Oleiphilus sp. HI0068]KZY84156.1 hypothetical protein A3741_16295 [Oleiphilus sp. HI0069]KZZ47276.1 hypothetical protein A3755_02400 [Oleiphilus sp. HI0085]KZZ76738.1 hypothetical protein A3766_13185 [Oleiphilus sp. HI0132]